MKLMSKIACVTALIACVDARTRCRAIRRHRRRTPLWETSGTISPPTELTQVSGSPRGVIPVGQELDVRLQTALSPPRPRPNNGSKPPRRWT